MAEEEPPPVNRKFEDLIGLNAYCLFKIFDYLTLGEICRMAEVNHQLYNVAKHYFWMKYGWQIGELIL